MTEMLSLQIITDCEMTDTLSLFDTKRDLTGYNRSTITVLFILVIGIMYVASLASSVYIMANLYQWEK